MSDTDFSQLQLHTALLQNLAALAFTQMTPVQQLSLPAVLAGRDVMAQGKTGSGKTAAFGLGILQKLDATLFKPQALILCPTRELSDQVAEEIRRLARLMPNVKVLSLCGGRPIAVQADSLNHGAHIIVGTPGRIEDHLQRRSLELANINCLVLDEADRMLDMGFLPSVENVLAELTIQKSAQSGSAGRPQILFFSATYSPEIRYLSDKILLEPVYAQLQETETAPDIDELTYLTGDDESRLDALKRILLHFKPDNALVFCTTRNDVDEVCQRLTRTGFSALALHGEMDQRDRDQAFIRFSNGSARVLVATDVAARGLDIIGLDLVVNYHEARDRETHTHRIGRTGRAGAKGRACTFTSFDKGTDQALSALPPASVLKQPPPPASMATLIIDGGKRDKIRPTDVLGALTGTGELDRSDVGNIRITHQAAYVAINRQKAELGKQILSKGKIKGKTARVRAL
ncbi:MAG: ATP-dependent RNA helicase DbpA [Pseudohongiella sp.]|nr:ATP-dependent RNA helicase DbpA [Pseudohongiella sp.]